MVSSCVGFNLDQPRRFLGVVPRTTYSTSTNRIWYFKQYPSSAGMTVQN